MSENIYNQRIDYTKNNFLEENNLPDNPFELFHGWYKVALDQVDKDPNAMILSTLKDDRPRARAVGKGGPSVHRHRRIDQEQSARPWKHRPRAVSKAAE